MTYVKKIIYIWINYFLLLMCSNNISVLNTNIIRINIRTPYIIYPISLSTKSQIIEAVLNNAVIKYIIRTVFVTP